MDVKPTGLEAVLKTFNIENDHIGPYVMAEPS